MGTLFDRKIPPQKPHLWQRRHRRYRKNYSCPNEDWSPPFNSVFNHEGSWYHFNHTGNNATTASTPPPAIISQANLLPSAFSGSGVAEALGIGVGVSSTSAAAVAANTCAKVVGLGVAAVPPVAFDVGGVGVAITLLVVVAVGFGVGLAVGVGDGVGVGEIKLIVRELDSPAALELWPV